MQLVILCVHFLGARLSRDSILCAGNPEAHAKDTEGFQGIFMQQLRPKKLRWVTGMVTSPRQTQALW